MTQNNTSSARSDYDYRNQLDKLNKLSASAKDAGWLSQDDVRLLEQHDDSQLVSLFKKQGEKPLIVAFFGGTGVGKSSLLNRLAGEEIAITGVQRPTSMEVTLYLHSDFKGDLLPANLPTEGTRIAWHNQDNRRFVAWLDLPDMDSTARENAALVEAWLPLVDWIIYVVSPERYHDDMGWRFLQSRGQQHAWLFVMNHWDQGTDEQLDDFRSKLAQAKFTAPTILRSSCLPENYLGTPVADDFPKLEATINEAINQHGLALLQSLGIQAQIETGREHLTRYLQKLDDTEKWQQAKTAWNNTCDQYIQKLTDQLTVSAKALSQGIETQQQGKAKLQSMVQKDMPLTPEQLSDSIWGHRNESLLGDMRMSLINQLQAEQLPFLPFSKRLDAAAENSALIIKQQLEDATTAAMAKPGTALQRFFYKLTDTLSWLLPLAAAGWAVFHVAMTFLHGTQGEKAFLGINFAIHSGLLMGLSWLIPWLLKRRLKPSLFSAIHRGLNAGIATGKTALQTDLKSIWQETLDDKQVTTETIQSLEKEFTQLKTNAHQQVGQYVSHR